MLSGALTIPSQFSRIHSHLSIYPRFSHSGLLIYYPLPFPRLSTLHWLIRSFSLGVSFPTILLSPLVALAFLSLIYLQLFNCPNFPHSFFHTVVVLFSSLSKQGKVFPSVIHVHCREEKITSSHLQKQQVKKKTKEK